MSDFQFRVNIPEITVTASETTPAPAQVNREDWPRVTIATNGWDTFATIRVPIGTSVSAARAMYNSHDDTGMIPTDHVSLVNGNSVAGSHVLGASAMLEFTAGSKTRGN